MIPLVDLRAGFEEVRGEVLAGFVDALESMRLFIGPNTTALESEFARFIGSRDCIGVSNGTDALVLALEACGVGPGDEVIVPSHTFFATVEAVIHVGAVPVFVDVDPVTLTIDPGAVAAAVGPRARAVMPVHLYGHPADMAEIGAVAARHGLTVIEDVSQAHGARAHGRAVGTFGRAAGFSCYFTKNLGAYGEAGLITTDDAEVAGRVRLLRNHGHATKERHDAVGYNFRLDELQAVVLRARLKRLAADNERRRRIAGKYRERLAGVPGITLPATAAWAEHVFHLFVIRSDDRDRLRDFLAGREIGTGIHYAVPVHRQPAIEARGLVVPSLPVTERIVGEILSLPVYPQMTETQVDQVCDAIRAFAAQGSLRTRTG